MRFCSECGTALVVDGERRRLVCPRCGTEEPIGGGIVYSSSGPDVEKIAVIGEEERRLRTTPEVSAECSRCGNGRAYWWMVQTRRADESPTQFYRCTKCGHTWREYS